MSFTHPAILLILWLVPLPGVLIVWSRHRQKRQAARLVHPNSMPRRRNPAPDAIFNAQLGLILISLALIITAAAGPRWGEREEIVLSSGRNVLILLDVSRSMLATDVRPNRLERAKADLADLLAELQGDRAGIMAFRNGTALLCPFTTDRAFLSQTLSGITIDSAPRGETDIGGAITAALATFKDLDVHHNAIILISDGEDLTGRAVEKAAEAREQGIPIFCVGIGDAKGATIPTNGNTPMSYRGESVITKLDNQTLLDIATTSKGAYIPLQTSATGRTTLGTLYNRHVRTILAREMQETQEARLVERFQLFLIPGLLAMLAAAMLSSGRPGRKRRKAPASIACLLIACCLATPTLSAADIAPLTTNTTLSAIKSPVATEAKPLSAQQLARQAQRASKKGDYESAANLYDAAREQTPIEPALERTLRFNAALARLQAGNVGQAAEHFRALADDADLGAEASEGLGVALFRAADALSAEANDNTEADPATAAQKKVKLLESAAAAFQTAMRNLPENDRRRQNLAAAIADLPRLREEARIAAILAKYGDKTPEDLAKELLQKQRNVYATAAATFANETPAKITLLEQAAERQRAAADIWTPLHTKLLEAATQSITNKTQLADFKLKLDTAKDQAESATTALADLDPEAMKAMRMSETTALELLSMTAPPPIVLAESLLAQSNALARALDPGKPRQPIEDQRLSTGFFNHFADQYGPWLDQLQASAAEDNPPDASINLPTAGPDKAEAPVVTIEVRKTIDDLVSQTLGSHALVEMETTPNDVLLSDKARINAEKALDNMIKIMELLPKPPQQEQQKSDEQEKQDQQDDQQDNQKQDSESDSQNQDQEDDEQEQPEASEPEDQENDEQQKAAEEEEEEEQQEEAAAAEALESADEKEAARIMAEILDQEKQREEERRRQQRSLPPRPGERDW